jgi:carboxylesterase
VHTTGILLIHGFAGNIEEIKPLRDYLIQKGYPVECPLLQGHGLTKRELSLTSYRDWIASAELACLNLSKRCDRIVAVGFSMGGLIAVNLWNYGFSGFVTVNTPIYYWNPWIIAGNLTRDFRRYGAKYLAASMDKSLSSMLEFQKLLTKTKPMFGNITCKTMVVQVLDDDTVHRKSAEYILKKIRAEKSLLRLPSGGHLVFQTTSGNAICEAIDRFIESC